MESTTQQADLEGNEVDPEVDTEKRSRPSIRIRSEHFEMRTNARVIRNTRKKDQAQKKFWDKVKPRKDVRSIPDGAYEEEGREIVAAAMYCDLPDHDEEWESL